MTSKGNNYPYRVARTFQGKKGQVMLDQARTVDKMRLLKKLGALTDATARDVSSRLLEMFGY